MGRYGWRSLLCGPCGYSLGLRGGRNDSSGSWKHWGTHCSRRNRCDTWLSGDPASRQCPRDENRGYPGSNCRHQYGCRSLHRNNAELADIFDRGLKDQASLSSVESTRFTFIVMPMVQVSSGSYFEAKLGGDSTFHARNVEGLRFLRAPGGRTWWAKNKRTVQTEFADWVETELGLGTESTAQATASFN